MADELPDLPIHILSVRVLDDGNVGIDALTPYGRRITTVIPRWNTTAEGIDDALRAAWAWQLEADEIKAGVLASIAADESDSDAVDDPDTDPTTG